MTRARAAKAVLAALGAALYAALAIASGLDRMSAERPALAAKVPAAFAVEAARATALRAIARGDGSDARAAALVATARDPVEARSLGLLGQAALTTGDAAYARRVFTVARALGWREPFTQLYWMGALLAQADTDGAADRLDALLRQTPDLAQRNLLLVGFDATLEGREALAERLARNPAWAANYFNDTRAPLAGDPLARSEVALLLAQRHGARDCALVAPLLEGLWRHGHVERAHEIYALDCAPPGERAPADGGFERADPRRPATIFDWRFDSAATVDAKLRPVAGFAGRAVVVSNGAPERRRFARQLLALAPGRYRLAWRALAPDGAASRAIDAALVCGDRAGPWLDKRLIDPRAGGFAATFAIPADCASAQLALGVAGSADAVAVDDVRIDPAASVAHP